MTVLITTCVLMKDHLKRIWSSDLSEPVLAQSLPERLFLSLLVLATFFSARGAFTRWSFGIVSGTDLYHLFLAFGLFAASLASQPPPWLALAVLMYVVYEVISWSLFDLFVLVRFPDLQGIRTPVRSFIWGAYCYGIVIWAYGLYFWSSGQVLDSTDNPLPSGLAGVYFSAITIATVGYGDYSPAKKERVLQLVVATEPFIGLVIVGVYLAFLVSVHASASSKTFR